VQNVSNLGFQAMASLDVVTAAELAQRLEAFFNSSLALAEKREGKTFWLVSAYIDLPSGGTAV
jgi:hypothetical protein